jgi:hypothetical protein
MPSHCWHLSSTTKVSCHAFALLAFELVTSTTNISSAKSALKALAEMQPSADISQNLGSQLIFQLIDVSISNKDEMCSASQLAANEHKGLIKSIMPFIFQLSVGSKQVHQRILKQVLVNVWSSNAISYFGPNQHESSCAYLLAAHSKCLNSHESSCASKVARAKCLNSRESSCASKVARAKCLNSHESSCGSLLVARAKCLYSNESSCTFLLAVHAKPLKSNKTQRMTPSLSLKFIRKSILEEARFAPTTLQAFKLIDALTSIADFQLIVDLFLNPNCEGARADVTSATICNKSIELIDVLSSEGDFSVPANFGNTDSEGARAPSTIFPTLHNRKSKYCHIPLFQNIPSLQQRFRDIL